MNHNKNFEISIFLLVYFYLINLFIKKVKNFNIIEKQ